MSCALAADRGADAIVQGRGLHAGSGPRGGDVGGVRRPAPGGSGRIASARSRSPARGRSSGPRRPTRPSASADAARRSPSCGWNSSARPIGLRPSSRRIRARHSYEEPAIDVYPLHDARTETRRPDLAGAGRLGRLDPPSSLADFAARGRPALGSYAVQMVGDPRRPIVRRRGRAAGPATTSSRTPPVPGRTSCSPARRDSTAASRPRRSASP